MRAQLSRFNHYRFSRNSISHRMEARIEAVEEELRQEKQKNAALQQGHLSTSLNPGESSVATVSQSSGEGKTAKTTTTSGSGDGLKTKRELKNRRSSQDGLEQLTLLDCSVQRKRSLGEDGDNQLVSPVKRRKQQGENEGGLSRSRGRLSSQSGSQGVPNSPRRSKGGQNIPTRSRGLPSTPTSSRGLPSSPAGPRGVRPNSGRLRSAAIAASAAVASRFSGGRLPFLNCMDII